MSDIIETREHLSLDQATTFICRDCGNTAKAFPRIKLGSNGEGFYDPPVVCDGCGVLMDVVEQLSQAIDLHLIYT